MRCRGDYELERLGALHNTLAGKSDPGGAQGSALELPFTDDHFDVVWTEHVQMNISEKAQFYGEISRVLKPGGQLVFHDIFAAGSETLEFPVPWASDATISHLIGIPELQTLLRDLGFEPVRWEDRTEAFVAFFHSVFERVQTQGWMPLGLHLLMGNDAAHKFSNVLHNLEKDRLRVVQAVMDMR